MMTIPSIEMNMNGFQTPPTPLAGSEATALFADPQMNSNGGLPVDAATVPLSASVAPENHLSRLPTPALDAAAVSRFREAMAAPLAENARLQGVLNQAVRQIVRQPVDPKFVEALAIAANLAPSDSPKEVVIENGSPVVKDVSRPAVEKDVPHSVVKTSERDARPDQTVQVSVGVGVLETPHEVGTCVPRDRVDEFSQSPQPVVRVHEAIAQPHVSLVGSAHHSIDRFVAASPVDSRADRDGRGVTALPVFASVPPETGNAGRMIEMMPPSVRDVAVTATPTEAVLSQPIPGARPEVVSSQPVPEKVPERVERPVLPMAEMSKAVVPETVSVASRGEQVIPASVDETEREEEVARAMVLPSPVPPSDVAAVRTADEAISPLTVSPVAVERAQGMRGTDLLTAIAGEVADAILVSPGLLRGQGEICIHLKPDVLAGTEVRLEVTGRTLSVEFQPVVQDVAVLINQNLPQLQQQLVTRIHAFDISVSVRPNVSVGRLSRRRER